MLQETREDAFGDNLDAGGCAHLGFVPDAKADRSAHRLAQARGHVGRGGACGQAARFQLFKQETLPLAAGERIRITRTLGRLAGGSLHTVKGVTPGGETEVLATMDDGAPVLLSSRRGKGRVFVFASTVDRDWSDIAIRTSFLPLMQRIAAWLTGSLDEREEVKAEVGGQVMLTPEPGQSPAWARAPSGAEVALTAVPACRVSAPRSAR